MCENNSKILTYVDMCVVITSVWMGECVMYVCVLCKYKVMSPDRGREHVYLGRITRNPNTHTPVRHTDIYMITKPFKKQ